MRSENNSYRNYHESDVVINLLENLREIGV